MSFTNEPAGIYVVTRKYSPNVDMIAQLDGGFGMIYVVIADYDSYPEQ